MTRRRQYLVGEQASNVLAVYQPTERLEGGEVTAQVWRDDFSSEQEWRDAAAMVARALNELGAAREAPPYEEVGKVEAYSVALEGPRITVALGPGTRTHDGVPRRVVKGTRVFMHRRDLD